MFTRIQSKIITKQSKKLVLKNMESSLEHNLLLQNHSKSLEKNLRF